MIGDLDFSYVRDWWLGFSDWLIQLCQKFQWLVDSENDDWISKIDDLDFSYARYWWLGFSDWFIYLCHNFQWLVDSENDDWILLIDDLNSSYVRDWWLGFSDWLIQLCWRLITLLQWWVIVWLLVLILNVDKGSSLKIWWNMVHGCCWGLEPSVRKV